MNSSKQNLLAAIVGDPLFKQAFSSITAGTIGVGLWGVVTGLAIVKSGLTVWQAIVMSLLVYSGTAQLAALPLIAVGAPVLGILTTATLVSLRFVVYSAIIAKYFGEFSFIKRTTIGYLTIDSGLAAYTSQVNNDWSTRQRLTFWAGCNLPIWLAWQVGSIAGIFLADTLPDSSAYGFIGILAIFAMVPPMLKGRPMFACALAATIVATLGTLYGQALPLGVVTAAAVLAGMLAAIASQSRDNAKV